MSQYELLPHEKPYDTGVRCIHCKQGTIVAEVELLSVPGGGLIGGPPRIPWEPKVRSFYCNNPNCLLVIIHPPHKPNMAMEIEEQIYERFSQERAREQRDRFSPPPGFFWGKSRKGSRRRGRRFLKDNGIG